jgi:hypothetical protein
MIGIGRLGIRDVDLSDLTSEEMGGRSMANGFLLVAVFLYFSDFLGGGRRRAPEVRLRSPMV